MLYWPAAESVRQSITGTVLPGDAAQKVVVTGRMLWAVKRKTTRKEDVAYSLIGIFDIYMPLIYGEGKKAFIRLKESGTLKHKYVSSKISPFKKPSRVLQS
jgi:hypothetical protein